MTSTLTSQPTSLYRLFDAEGSLLYVGITVHFLQRVQQHSVGQTWWEEVARIEVEHFADRLAAGAAEIHAINTESPRYNIKDVKIPRTRRDASADPVVRDVHAVDPTTTTKRGRGQPPKHPDLRRELVRVRLPGALLARLKATAASRGMTLTDVVEEAVVAGLGDPTD